MLVRILRHRLLALLLLAGSPGLGGLALAALHPCAAAAAAASGGEAADEHHGGNHGAPADDTCRCIGACQAAFAAPKPAAVVVAHTETPPSGTSRLSGDSPVADASTPRHRHPPSTAPPQA